MTKKYSYLTCCVHETDGDAINAMKEVAVDINYQTFIKRCNWRPWAQTLGYQLGKGPDLRLETDWHVRYYRSVYLGTPCYYAVHSGIEHIFTVQEQPADIRRPR